MAKHRVILAELDEEYVFPLELKFLEEMRDDIELEVITDRAYFEEYFEKPKKAEILIVGDELYASTLRQHNINHIFVLCERQDQLTEEYENVQTIYKYTSIKHIYNQVMFSLSGELLGGKSAGKETEVIMVYSAIGGCGKTTVSLGLANCLAQNFKRVLYIDAEYIQNAHYLLRNQAPLTTDLVRQLHGNEAHPFQKLSHCIRNEGFDYLPPFRASLSALNLDYGFYQRLISEVKATRKYDYIIVDTDCVFDEGKTGLIDMANRLVLIMMQDSYSVMKTDMLLNSMDITEEDKIMYICNHYRPDRKNMLLEQSSRYMISNYIERQAVDDTLQLRDLLAMDGIQKLTFELL